MTVNCVGCYRIVTVILHQINFENHSTNNWPNHCFRRFHRSISAGSIVAVVSQMKDATRILPVPPRRGRALPPILVINLILLILEATQGRQCFFEISSCRNQQNSNGSTNCFVHINFFLSSVVCVILVRQFYPSHELLLQCDPFRSWSFGILHHR